MRRLSAFINKFRPAVFKKPRIHLYALCWNESHMLPFFFQHYDTIVDRYFIFDNHSTDDSKTLLENHPRVTLGQFDVEGRSFVQAAQQFNNNCWKSSRGCADWVIVCNIDEHLYHTNLLQYLNRCRRRGISLIRPKGYEMVSSRFPIGSQPLHEQVRRGMHMNKPQLFAPDSIDEINFAPGRHTATPQGHVQSPILKQVKLLHYKYLGLAYMSGRLSELRAGLREGDIEKNWGISTCGMTSRRSMTSRGFSVPPYRSSEFPVRV